MLRAGLDTRCPPTQNPALGSRGDLWSIKGLIRVLPRRRSSQNLIPLTGTSNTTSGEPV
jgi:hypothetical protein